MILLRHPHVLQRDQAVLNHLERDLAVDLLHTESWGGFVLDDEGFDLVVRDVARPDDRNVAPGRITDPFFLPVEDPGVAFALRGRQKSAGSARTNERLGQAETTDLFETRHWRQPLPFLLFRSGGIN